MDRSADGSVIVEASANGGDVRPSRVRRRLIQSTLFPHKSPDESVEIDDKQDQEDDEEYCGSQSNKKRKRKPKALAQPRAPKKVSLVIFLSNLKNSSCLGFNFDYGRC